MTKNQKIRSIVERLLVLASNPKMLRLTLRSSVPQDRFAVIVKTLRWMPRSVRKTQQLNSWSDIDSLLSAREVLAMLMGTCDCELPISVLKSLGDLSMVKASGVPDALKRLAEVLANMDKQEQHYRVEAGPDGLLFFPIR